MYGSTPEIQLTQQLAKYSDWTVMRDILIESNGTLMHMDFIILTVNAVFVCELKTFRGRIEGEGMKKYWKQYTKNAQIDYYNPILQNLYHIRALKQFLEPLDYEKYFHSVVFMYGLDGAVLHIQPPMPPQSSIVTSTDKFMQVAQTVCEKRNMEITQADLEFMADFIGNHQVRGEEARLKHITDGQYYKQQAANAINLQRCPECMAPLKIATAPDGNYFVCSRYPECTYSHKVP